MEIKLFLAILYNIDISGLEQFHKELVYSEIKRMYVGLNQFAG